MNTPKTPIGRLASIRTIGNQTVNQVMKDMDEVGAGEVSSVFTDNNSNVLGALIFLHGPDTKLYLDAIENVKNELEDEEIAGEEED
ncbi:hypothetical protein [Halomonas llamarensis]|uniref:Uncharacterized protein n=1 Tax=Halomonas llamarensis TaxID=2945104 RepID=A0ABT0SV62_9GAMM|nr:hypothetical protein [Halomonas llamarensis]MCL7931713.1 hypothetical protein [Halomonas llamarensis]